jgi:hypothetical protein
MPCGFDLRGDPSSSPDLCLSLSSSSSMRRRQPSRSLPGGREAPGQKISSTVEPRYAAAACDEVARSRFRYARGEETNKTKARVRLIGVRPPGPRCAAPVRAALPSLYALPPRRCPVLSGRGSWGLRSRPIGSITAAAARGRCASALAAITATSIAVGSARGWLAGSVCVAPAHATNARSGVLADTPSDNDATARGEKK